MAVQREIEWERGGSYWSRGRSDRGMLMKDELTAINSLIENHREEFSSLVSEVETRRAWVEKKATRASKPKDRGGL
jgi:hypothetical protein